MDDLDLSTELLQRVKDLMKMGYQVEYEEGKGDLVKLHIRKIENNKDAEDQLFYY
jgi:hypothetical protein